MFLVHDSVAEEPNNQGSKQCRPRLRGVAISQNHIDVLITGKELLEIDSHRDEKDTPNKKLQEHHDAEFDRGRFRGRV